MHDENCFDEHFDHKKSRLKDMTHSCANDSILCLHKKTTTEGTTERSRQRTEEQKEHPHVMIEFLVIVTRALLMFLY